MARNDFVVGQTVYLKTVSHALECWKKEKIVEAIVSKIGRKYITVKTSPYCEYRFQLENDFREKTDYCDEFQLFLTEQAIYDYWQHAYLRTEIENHLKWNGEKLQLRALKDAAQAFGIPLDLPEKGARPNG